jgi:hypothetical protein
MLQTILFDKRRYSPIGAIKWLKKHGYKYDVDEDVNYYRFRQSNPIKNAKYYTKKIDLGISFVFQER